MILINHPEHELLLLFAGMTTINFSQIQSGEAGRSIYFKIYAKLELSANIINIFILLNTYKSSTEKYLPADDLRWVQFFDGATIKRQPKS
jgi:hypothetical protein